MGKDGNPKKLKYQTLHFDGIDGTLEERLEAIRKIGKAAEEEFTSKYQDINTWFTSDYDQLYILSFCMRYFLMHEEGYDEELEEGQFSFAPHYLEILQAIALSHERVYSARPLWHETEKLRDHMKEVGKLVQSKLLKLPEDIKTKEDFHAFRIRTDMMGYNLAVRNWAYHHQMKKVAEDMAKTVQQEFIAVYSADPVALVQLLFAIGEEMEKRVNNHLKKVHNAIVQKDYIKIQQVYQKEFDTVQSSTEDLERFWEMTGKDLSSLRAFLLAHSDIRLPDLFTYSIDELEQLSANTITKEALAIIFDKLSYKFGDLTDFKQEHIILDNPVHEKPFIKVEDGKYFTALGTILPHLTISLLENLVAETESLSQKYNECRAEYLEIQTELLFKRSFPDAEVFRGSQYGDNYENDLLVVIDSFAIVVEAKAGIVTKPAKRGAPKRLFNTIKELVEAPSEQALRFINFLKANKGKHEFKTKHSSKNIVDISKVNYFIPLGVTFYHLGAIGTNLKLLVEARVTDKQLYELAPSICLTDLQVIFEILDTQAQKVHYLHRRREFETQVDYFADEQDLLGFYLDTGFNLGDMENEPHLMIDASLNSKILDPYFIAINDKGRPKKPSLAMTEWWRNILARLEERKVHRWLEFSYILLNLNKWAQNELENRFKELVQSIINKSVEQRHNWITFLTAKEERRYIVIGYPYLKDHLKERNDMIQTIINMAFEENPNAKGVVVIGINIDEAYYPYSVLAGDLAVQLFDDLFISMSA